MAKLFSMFLLLVGIQAVLLLFAAQTPANTNIWSMVSNPTNWNSVPFILTIAGVAGTLSLVGIAVGSAFGFKTDFIIFAASVPGLLSMGVVFVNLYNVVRTDLIARLFTSCLTALSCPPVDFILAITVGTLAFFYAWTVVEWWRGKDF